MTKEQYEQYIEYCENEVKHHKEQLMKMDANRDNPKTARKLDRHHESISYYTNEKERLTKCLTNKSK